MKQKTTTWEGMTDETKNKIGRHLVETEMAIYNAVEAAFDGIVELTRDPEFAATTLMRISVGSTVLRQYMEKQPENSDA